MYGLPKDLDLSFFIGKELETVVIGAHYLQLRFGDEVSIGIGSAVSFENQDLDSLVSAGQRLAGLLGSTIKEAAGEKDGDLALVFSGGQRVVIHELDDNFESYTFWSPGGLVVV